MSTQGKGLDHELTVSVIVCAWSSERWDDLFHAIASLGNQSIRPEDIIVVIDHNADLFAHAQSALADVTVIENMHPRGLSGARNSGVAIAQGDLIAFLDDDAIAAADWVATLKAEYRDPAVIGVGGAIVPTWHAGRPVWFPEEFDWVVGCTYLGMPTEAAEVRNLIGCNMSFRREILAAVGAFRTGIGRVGSRPVSGEETELCIRIHNQFPTQKLLYQPRVVVHHRVPAARSQWAYFRARCYAEGLSKALVARLVGSKDGLSSERAYTMSTLPAGVTRGIGEGLLRGKLASLGKAAAIVAGLGITCAGYVVGRISRVQITLPADNPALGIGSI